MSAVSVGIDVVTSLIVIGVAVPCLIRWSRSVGPCERAHVDEHAGPALVARCVRCKHSVSFAETVPLSALSRGHIVHVDLTSGDTAAFAVACSRCAPLLRGNAEVDDQPDVTPWVERIEAGPKPPLRGPDGGAR